MSRILRAYLRVLEKHPWKTQAVSTGVLMGAGDALSQLVVERCPLNKYDPVRSSWYVIFGAVGVSPILRSWYIVLERMWGPTTNIKKLLCKVGMDQLLFAPAFLPFIVGSLTFWDSKSLQYTQEKLEKLMYGPFYVVYLVGTMSFFQHKSLEAAQRKLEQDYWSILTTNWKIWPAVQLINFYYIPFQHRIMYVQTVALFWNTYLAWKINIPPKEDQDINTKL